MAQGSGPTTRGGLVPARIYEVDDAGKEKRGSGSVYCTFNPYQYTISLGNSFSTIGLDKNSNYQFEVDAKKAQPRKLTISELWFDTYETGKDVRTITDKLMSFAEMKRQQSNEGTKFVPTKVAFEWGTFRFLAVIESLSLDFVLFKGDGTPVRAKANLSFMEFKHRQSYPRQNPSSGGGPTERMWQVSAGERLDSIAAQVYGDAGKWPLIAARNKIDNPFALRNGQELVIPALKENRN